MDQLRLDGGTQPRAALSFETVDDYSELMANGAKFPAISVCYDGQLYWVVDGFHRIKAAWQAGLESIDAEVLQGTLQDAQWESYAVNHRHGLRRTNEDKQRAVKAALVHPSGGGLSDRQLARHCGVSTPTVSAWREKLGPSIKILEIGKRTVTRRGTTYQQDTANIGRRRSATTQSADTATAQQPTMGPAETGPTFEPPHEAVAAMKKIIALGLTADEFEAWLEQQSDQSELTEVLEKLNELINQVLTLGKRDAVHV
ncbi:MAG: helix-turn-helix domain-containing protein [Verrucomicrobia bacterium]|nr:helix-turn-helix domain-containing protein [Verrucomicrobiota bacterium]